MKNMFWVLIIIVFFSCESKPVVTSEDIDLKVIQSHFPSNTYYKSINMVPNFAKVLVLDTVKSNTFKEYQYNSNKWKEIGELKSELLGNVKQTDFLFKLDDSLQVSISHKIDSLNTIGKVDILTINTPNNFYKENKLNISLFYKQNGNDKVLKFNY